MKKFWKNIQSRCQQVSLTGRQKRWWIAAGICLCLAGGLWVVSDVIGHSQPSQQMAERWDAEGGSAQISCFFADGSNVVPDTLRAFGHSLDGQLRDASIQAPNTSARLWVDAYSAKGQIHLSSSRTSVSVGAYGVGGDYFLFHPLQLEKGSMYFDGDDLMQDQVILDQNTAWQLFGSYDIAGQSITIGSGPTAHVGVVAGVIESESGWMNEQAGAAVGTVYLSYEMLDRFGTHSGINAYEIVMPNPITGFARDMVESNIGFDENQIQIVENHTRYSLKNLLTVLSQFGTRSMNAKAIIYPYWENAARGWEDVLAALLLLQILLLILPVTLLVIGLWRLWKYHRPRWSDLRDWLQRQREAHWARQAAKRAEKGQESKSA